MKAIFIHSLTVERYIIKELQPYANINTPYNDVYSLPASNRIESKIKPLYFFLTVQNT